MAVGEGRLHGGGGEEKKAQWILNLTIVEARDLKSMDANGVFVVWARVNVLKGEVRVRGMVCVFGWIRSAWFVSSFRERGEYTGMLD